MARLRIPFLILITVAFSAQLGFRMRTDLELTSGDAAITTLEVQFVDSSPVANGWNGFIDRQYFVEPNIHVVEGWAVFPSENESSRRNQTLQIYAGESVKFRGAIRFQRRDLAGKPGAQGFIIYGNTLGNSGKRWCVVIPSQNTFLQLGGANC
jgi:hypothetical protein